jgi:hypothetical protein
LHTINVGLSINQSKRYATNAANHGVKAYFAGVIATALRQTFFKTD